MRLVVVVYVSVFVNLSIGQLISVIVLMRHGARSPKKSFSFDEYSSQKYWPDGCEQLTNQGRRKLFDLGIKIRSHYKTFLEPHNDIRENDIAALSSDSDRALESAEIVLASLYPPSEKQRWNQDLNWMPVPIPISKGISIYCRDCPYYKAEIKDKMNNFTKQPFYQAVNQEIMKLDTKGEVKSIADFVQVIDNVFNEIYVGYKKPLYFEKFDENELRKFFHEYYRLRGSATFSISRICNGLTADEIVSRMEKKLNGEDISKFTLYSGHESTIVGLMEILGLSLDENPFYGGSMIFELYSFSPTNNTVKILYSKNDSFVLEEMEIPGCGGKCPLHKLKEIVKPFVPTNWAEECHIEPTTSNSSRSFLQITLILICLLFSNSIIFNFC